MSQQVASEALPSSFILPAWALCVGISVPHTWNPVMLLFPVKAIFLTELS